MSRSPAAELRDLVVTAAEGTPYVVRPADGGFDLTVDLADSRWHTVLGQAGMRTQFTNQVRVRDDGSYTITDVMRDIDWVAGAPGVSGSASVMKGRQISLGGERAWGIGPDGLPVKVADFRFDSEEGRQLVSLAADSLGLAYRRGGVERGALLLAGLMAVAALAVVVVLGVALAMGRF